MSTSTEPPREQMLATRVLPMKAYLAELRKDKAAVAARLQRQFGTAIVPIPVPLVPGDTEAAYEQRYQKAQKRKSKRAKKSLSVSDERSTRCAFARRAVKLYRATQRAARKAEDEVTTQIDHKATNAHGKTKREKAPKPASQDVVRCINTDDRELDPVRPSKREREGSPMDEPPKKEPRRDTQASPEFTRRG